jgi:phosphoribosyl 1,2-cyclic phosphate phosphodiesterase
VFKPTQEGGGKPKLDLRVVQTEPDGATIGNEGVSVRVGDIAITPIPIRHGILPILGWRIGDTAYLTDCSEIPESSWPLLAGTRNLVIGALRVRPHSTHLKFDQAIAVIRRLDVERAWFTHLCHDFTHAGIRAWLAENAPDKKIEPAFDGLRITIR